MNPQYSYCETIHASGSSPWHIRKLTSAGQKFSGGADTNSLCGRKVSWDIKQTMNPSALGSGFCKKCAEEYLHNL